MSPLKRLLPPALVVLSLSALGACGGNASEPKAAILTGDGFSVNMPGKPTRKVVSVPTPAGPQQLTVYISKTSSEAFEISSARLSAGEGFNLDAAVRGEAANVQGTLRSVLTTTYQRFQTRDARITAQSNGTPVSIFERTILAKGEYFNLQYLRQGADIKSPPAAYTTFLASLKIK